MPDLDEFSNKPADPSRRRKAVLQDPKQTRSAARGCGDQRGLRRAIRRRGARAPQWDALLGLRPPLRRGGRWPKSRQTRRSIPITALIDIRLLDDLKALFTAAATMTQTRTPW